MSTRAPAARQSLGLVVEVGLLEDEGHPEQTLPEVDGRLAIRPGDRDVVDALALKLAHDREPSAERRRSEGQ